MEELFNGLLFHILALATVGGAIGVAITRDIVRAAFCLLCTLLATAGLFLLADAIFLGVVQILVYAGGTMVLLVFGIMLTSPRVQPLLSIRPIDRLFALGICLALLAVLLWSGLPTFGRARIASATAPRPTAEQPQAPLIAGYTESAPLVYPKEAELSSTDMLASALVGLRLDHPCDSFPRTRSGRLPYLFVFEIVSFHLLVVLIAAAYLARPRRPSLVTADDKSPKDPSVKV